MRIKDIPIGKLFKCPKDNLYLYYKNTTTTFRAGMMQSNSKWIFVVGDLDYKVENHPLQECTLYEVDGVKEVKTTFKDIQVGKQFEYYSTRYLKIQPFKIDSVEFNCVNIDSSKVFSFLDEKEVEAI